MLNDQSRKVTSPGHGTFWLIPSIFGSALAPLEDCDAEGNIEEFLNESYAHVFGEDIKRHGQKIGTIKDLIDAE